MANIDKRVVDMKFDNAAFERGVATTLSTLDKLKAGLGNLAGAAKGLGNFKINSQGLAPLGHGVDALITKFSALQVAGVTAIANIANKAVNAGTQMVNSLTVGPISGGLGEYEKKLDSIQTILANTAAAGTDLNQVSAALEELNVYSDKTIYNFGEMARNIGTFTAAGVDLKTATGSIKGIANLAALSGSSSEQAASAMYQLSQEIANGKVTLLGWNSVVNAGMGGSVFQRSLAETAVAMGKLPESAIKLEGAMKNVKINGKSFRESISAEGGGPTWLTSDVLTTALGNFTGDMKEADLVAQGFTKSQAAAIMAQAKTASNAATIVKTGSKLMDTLKESAESGWAKTWELIIGDFNEAPKLWTAINSAIGGLITNSADARNKVLQDWRFNNGRHFFLVGLKNAWNALLSIARPIRDAFREIFPATTGKQLADISEAFMKFTEGLIQGGETMQRIKSTFEGIFSILKIGVMIVSGAFKAIFAAVNTAGAAGGGILAFTATLGEMIRQFHDLLAATGIIDKFFKLVAAPFVLLKPLISLISNLAEAISKLVMGDIDGFASGITSALKELSSSFSDIGARFFGFIGNIKLGFAGAANVFDGFSKAAFLSGNKFVEVVTGAIASAFRFLHGLITNFRGTVDDFKDGLDGATSAGQGFLSGFGGGSLERIKSLIETINDKLVDLREKLNLGGVFGDLKLGAESTASGGMTALDKLSATAASIWGFLTSISEGVQSVLGPVVSGLASFFTWISARMKEFIQQLDMQEVIALINTGFMIYLFKWFGSFAKQGTNLFKNISQSFDQLTGTLKTMQNAIKAQLIMTIAIAVGVLVAALFVLAKIDSKALTQAVITLGILMAQMAAMMKVLAIIDPQSMIGAGVGMVAIAVAITILSVAIKRLGEMDRDVLIQGGLAIASIMAALAGFAAILAYIPGIVMASAALVVLSVALVLMAGAIALYAALPWSVIEQGLGAMALTLIALGFAMGAFPKGMLLKSVGILILSKALLVLTASLTVLGMLPLTVLAKGIITMAAAMAILVIAANAMTGGIAGAAAMLIMAGAIAVLAPAIALLGNLSMETIGKGLLVIAAVMAIFVASMYALAPVIVVMAIFSKALMTLGLAMLAAGVGFGLFVAALGLLTVVGAAGFAVLIAGILSLGQILPLLAQQAAHAVIAFIAVLDSAIPRILEFVGKMMVAFAQEVAQRVPQLAQAGLSMILGLLIAINSKIYMLTYVAISIVKNFLQALSDGLPGIIAKGVDFILSFVEGLAMAIRGEKDRTGEAGADLAMAMVEGMISGLKAFVRMLPPQVEALARAAITAFKKFLGINSPSTVFAGFGGDIVMGLINGIGKFVGKLVGKVQELGSRAISAAKQGLSSAASIGGEFVGKIVSGVTKIASNIGTAAKSAVTGAISAGKKALSGALEIGSEIVNGIAQGIRDSARKVKEAAVSLAEKLPGWVKKVLGIASPSKEFIKIGKYVNQGFVKGLTDGNRETATATYNNMKEVLASGMKAASEDIKEHEARLKTLTSARKVDAAAVKKTQQALATSRRELALSTAAHKELTVAYLDEQRKITGLADKYSALTPKLEEAQKVLDDAIKTRNDFAKSTADQYADLPDVTPETSVEDYVKDVNKRIRETKRFAVLIQELRSMGLNDTTYAELLSKGVTAIPFMDNLTAMGPAAVAEINDVTSELRKEAQSLGNSASISLYQAGVDSAQGIVNGIKSQRSAIVAEMEALATAMLQAIKKKLGIKSPSKAFEELGRWSNQGLAKGLKDYSSVAERSAEDLGTNALLSLRNSLSGVSKIILGEIDDQPIIRPVIDLSEIKNGAGLINSMMSSAPALTLDVAYSNVTAASEGYTNNKMAQLDAEETATRDAEKISFIQHNTSPKALSQAEIYRQTKNQLSVAKEVLARAK